MILSYVYALFVVSNNIGCYTSTVALKSYSGKYVVAESDGTANANRTKSNLISTGFTVEDRGTGRISLLSHYGKYLFAVDRNGGYTINANRAIRHGTGQGGVFTVEKQAGGTIALKTAHGRYVGTASDGRLMGSRTDASIWERFSPECLTGICSFYQN